MAENMAFVKAGALVQSLDKESGVWYAAQVKRRQEDTGTVMLAYPEFRNFAEVFNITDLGICKEELNISLENRKVRRNTYKK